MFKIIKSIIIASLIVFALTIGANILAQENTNSDVTIATINEQVTVTAQDLGVSDPKLLPDNPFYFLKEWGRGIQSFFAFGQLKKAELEQKFANERLVEIQKLVDEGKISSDILEKATDKYEKTMEKIKERADKIKENASDSEEVNKFLEKFTNQQILHEKILQKLEEQVPEQVLEKIKEAREQHLERFKDVMIKLENNKEKIAERLQNALQSGNTDNPEILDKIKEKMPDDVQQKIEAVRTEVVNKVIQKIQQSGPVGANCPILATVDPATFCPNGKIEAERDSNGCVIKINCVTEDAGKSPLEQRCVNQKCQANGATCEFDYQCPAITQENIDCEVLWWFDNDNRTCQQKKFCGAYTYQGLRTFGTKEACLEYLNVLMGKSCSNDADCGTSSPSILYRCEDKKCVIGLPFEN